MIGRNDAYGVADGREIAALVGVAPLNRDSGTMRGRRTVWGGPAHLLAQAAADQAGVPQACARLVMGARALPLLGTDCPFGVSALHAIRLPHSRRLAKRAIRVALAQIAACDATLGRLLREKIKTGQFL